MTEVINVRNTSALAKAIAEGRYVYIGRGSKWGNEYTHKPLRSTKASFQVKTRDEAIACYERDLNSNVLLLADLQELKDKVLGCYCHPYSCHGHVLARKANALCLCTSSTGICGCITQGTGKLDFNGYWEHECPHGNAFTEYTTPEETSCSLHSPSGSVSKPDKSLPSSRSTSTSDSMTC